MTKTLYLMRHAKSSWKDTSLPDLERPLTRRGKKAARRMALELAKAVPAPALVLCSPATRALQTYEELKGHLRGERNLQVEDALYGASADALLSRLQALPESSAAVLLIGHNPGVQDLLTELFGDGQATRHESRLASFPTGALAIVRVTGSWAELDRSTASLEDVLLPRSLAA